MTTKKKTTAILRIEASEAESKLNWSLAAELYQMALDVFPTSLKGELYEKDRAALSSRAKRCKIAAQRSAKK